VKQALNIVLENRLFFRISKVQQLPGNQIRAKLFYKFGNNAVFIKWRSAAWRSKGMCT
jgi:hypothetical protein